MDSSEVSTVNFLAGDGVMRTLMHNRDWSTSSLGPPAAWPQALKSIVVLMLDSKCPMFVAWGSDLALLYNDAYSEILGGKHPWSLGRSVRHVWEEIWPAVGPMVERALRCEASYFRDVPLSLLRKKHIEQTWFTFSCSPARGDDGKVAGMFCVCTETTAQVLAERHHSFRLALGDRIRSLDDPDEIKALVTEALTQHLGVSRVGYGEIDTSEETLHVARDSTDGMRASLAGASRRLDDFGPDIISELRAGHVLRLDDIENDPRTAPYANVYAGIDARSLLLIPLIREGRFTTILYLHRPQPYHWTDEEETLAVDIAERTWAAVERARADRERRKAEQALSTQLSVESNRLRTLFQQAPGFMAVLRGPEHVFELANAAYLRLIGNRDVIGKPVHIALPEIAGQRFLSLLDQVFRSGEPFFAKEEPIFLQQKPGAPIVERFVDFIYQPVTDVDGAVSGIFVEGYDVTERKHATQALHDADRRKDEFLAMLAHELRNPLAPISSAAQLLKIGNLAEQRVRETSDIIARQVDHITSLVDDLLDVSRVTRGLISLDKSVIDLRDVMAGAVEQVRALTQVRHHCLSIHAGDRPVYVLGDRARLVQVVANLLNNAAKYTPDNGDITLQLEAEGTDACIRVRDNGVGISGRLLPYVFDLFTQEKRSPDRSQGGLGLGLALVKRLVELHGGSVTAASGGAGTGSEFTVRLPRVEPDQSQPTVIDNNVQRSRHTLRLMVVDDNVDAARILATLLEVEGYRVMIKHDAHSALEYARAETPDACLLDIGLPDTDGYELAWQLRQIPTMRDATLIALTGYGRLDDVERSRAVGFDHHLTKPADIQKLFTILAGIEATDARPATGTSATAATTDTSAEVGTTGAAGAAGAKTSSL